MDIRELYFERDGITLAALGSDVKSLYTPEILIVYIRVNFHFHVVWGI
jgi:hypothetical protein